MTLHDLARRQLQPQPNRDDPAGRRAGDVVEVLDTPIFPSPLPKPPTPTHGLPVVGGLRIPQFPLVQRQVVLPW